MQMPPTEWVLRWRIAEGEAERVLRFHECPFSTQARTTKLVGQHGVESLATLEAHVKLLQVTSECRAEQLGAEQG